MCEIVSDYNNNYKISHKIAFILFYSALISLTKKGDKEKLV